MIQYLEIKQAQQILQNGETILLVDDENLDGEVHVVAVAKPFLEKENFQLFNLETHSVMIALGHTKFGEISNAQKNSNMEYDELFIHLEAKKNGKKTDITSLQDTLSQILQVESTAKDFRFDGRWQVVPTRQGGTLKRAASPEAIVDLAKLIGQDKVGLVQAKVDNKGNWITQKDLKNSKETFQVLQIAEIIRYRSKEEILVKRITSAKMPTKYGEFEMVGYVNQLNGEHHVALVKGDVTTEEAVLVRVHSECLTGDSFGSMRCDCGDQLHTALRRIEKAGRGVVLYMRQEGRGIGLINKIRAYALQDQGMDTVEANLALGFPDDLRDYGIGAQMLVDLGIKKVKLMTNNPKKIHGLSGYGIQIENRVKIQLNHNERNEFYMRTKKEKMGHILSFENEKE